MRFKAYAQRGEKVLRGEKVFVQFWNCHIKHAAILAFVML